MNAEQLEASHRHHSASFFHRCWTLLDQADRSAADEVEMEAAAWASLAHWQARTDVTPRNLSIAHWLLSRVFATLGRGEASAQHAALSPGAAGAEAPFFVGYAWEAVARAAVVQGRAEAAEEALGCARESLAEVDDEDSATLLRRDLKAVEELLRPMR